MLDQQFGGFRGLRAILAGVLFIGVASCATTRPESSNAIMPAASQRQRTSLDANWSFHLGDISPNNEVIAAGYDDKAWKSVDVPHDYVLDGTYSATNDRGHGYLPLDVGWYRKRIVIPASDAGKILKLDFDGVFRDSEVWFNGQSLGRHPSGYTPFSYDITKLAKLGAENVIAVRVDPRQPEGWWYEGGGIYQQCEFDGPSRRCILKRWGTHVVATVPGGDQGIGWEADLTIQTTLENSGTGAANCKIVSEILGLDGGVLKTLEMNDAAPASSSNEVTQQAVIQHPALWSIQTPALYHLRTTVWQDGKPVDSSVTNFRRSHDSIRCQEWIFSQWPTCGNSGDGDSHQVSPGLASRCPTACKRGASSS